MKLRRGLYVDFKPRPGGGWRAEIRIQISDAGDCYRFAGTDDQERRGGPAVALRRAVAGASAMLGNPLVLHVLPAGSLAAVSAIGALADAAREGLLGRRINGRPVYEHLSGHIGKLARELHAHQLHRTGPAALAGGPLLLAK